MEWTKDHRLGIRDLDEQHQEIVRSIASINEAIARQDPLIAVHMGLVNLANLARIHFVIEEALMRIHEYPNLSEHVSDHQQFAADVKALEERSHASSIAQDSIHSLYQWWDVHIQKHDRPYALHFLKRMALGKP